MMTEDRAKLLEIKRCFEKLTENQHRQALLVAELIRSCVHAIQRERLVYGSECHDMRKLREGNAKIEGDRLRAFESLEALAAALEKDTSQTRLVV